MINTYSIKDSKEFQRVIQKGQWVGGEYLSTYVLQNKDNKNYIGLAIGKKAGKAFKRNKIKRLIRAGYTELEKDVNYGFNIVFVWKTKAIFDTISYDAILKDIKRAFSKSGVFK